MKAVSNSSPLIFATKIEGLMDLLLRLFSEIIVPDEVFMEIVKKGVNSKNPTIQKNALKLKKLADDKVLIIKKVKNKSKLNELKKHLGIGEAAAIALAVEEKIQNILIDERKGTVYAKLNGLVPSPISALIIECAHKKLIEKNAARKLLDELLVNNYRLDVKTYNELIALLEESN